MNINTPEGLPLKLAALKQSLAQAGLETRERGAVPLGHDEADGYLKGGLRLGALHEVFAHDAHGGAATGFAMALAELSRRGKHLLWIRQDFSALEHGEISAVGFLEFGLHPARLLLMRAADATDALRAGLDALICAHLGTVVLEIPGNPKVLDLAASRRLTLAAENAGVTALLLRLSAHAEPSACETRWSVAAAQSLSSEDWGAPVFDVELQRNRHGKTGHWVMEWSADDGLFRRGARAADSGDLAAAPSDRPHPAAEGLRRFA